MHFFLFSLCFKCDALERSILDIFHLRALFVEGGRVMIHFHFLGALSGVEYKCDSILIPAHLHFELG
jgi:hypothetical protein